jgi:hypothetical protein
MVMLSWRRQCRGWHQQPSFMTSDSTTASARILLKDATASSSGQEDVSNSGVIELGIGLIVGSSATLREGVLCFFSFAPCSAGGNAAAKGPPHDKASCSSLQSLAALLRCGGETAPLQEMCVCGLPFSLIIEFITGGRFSCSSTSSCLRPETTFSLGRLRAGSSAHAVSLASLSS